MSQRRPGAAPDFVIACGNWFFKYRNIAFTVVLLALLIGFRPWPAGGDPALDRWLDAAGLIVILAGSALRLWVIGLAYIKRGGLNKKVHAERLVTGGMFGICRNPLYVGNAAVLLGLFVIHNHPAVYLLGIGFFGFAYWAIVATEERYLVEKFGDEYLRYCREVGRFGLNFSRYAQAAEGMAFNWRRAIAKDYSSVYAWVVGVIGLLTYQAIAWAPAPVDWAVLTAPVILLAIATVLLALVKLFKKSGVFSESAG